MTSKNIQAQPLDMSLDPVVSVEYNVISGDPLRQYFTVQSYSLENVSIAYSIWSGKPLKQYYVEDRMAAIREVLEMEKPAKEAYDKLASMNMSLNSIIQYLDEHNKTYDSLSGDEGYVEAAVHGIKEAYSELKGSLIATDIPPIPLGSETYNRLVELYGPLLEEYPSTSGRLQLLHAIFSST